LRNQKLCSLFSHLGFELSDLASKVEGEVVHLLLKGLAPPLALLQFLMQLECRTHLADFNTLIDRGMLPIVYHRYKLVVFSLLVVYAHPLKLNKLDDLTLFHPAPSEPIDYLTPQKLVLFL